MSVEFFEPRPPKVAAIKLDFLNDPDNEVAEKLCAMPLVDGVAIEYSVFGSDRTRYIVINPQGDTPLRIDRDYPQEWWLVCVPPTDPGPLAPIPRGELEIVQDRQFRRRYQPCKSESIDV
jgi:hypothetical protein